MLAAEKVGAFNYGDEVGSVTQAKVRGGKLVHDLGNGVSIFVQCLDGEDRASFMQLPAENDPRVLPQDLDPLGHPDCSLKEVAKKSHEIPMPWVLIQAHGQPVGALATWCLKGWVLRPIMKDSGSFAR